MKKYIVTGKELTDMADIIRTKGGTSSSLIFPDGFMSAISNLSGIYYEDALITRTISNIYINNRVTNIRPYAFQNCYLLTSVSFPECTTIGSYAFYDCYSLASVSFPVCTSIGTSAFYHCSSLTTANFPKCTTIGSSAFTYCRSLTEISFPACTSIGSYTFLRCYNLISLNLTGVSSVPTLGNGAFTSTPIGGYYTFAGQYGSVYVPASLYNSFLTAENWSDISERIVSYGESV